ncbi:FUSC family protein [Lentibacillus salicampi]|uniref:FUSC family protein n=1 Tax=Lentibacillus salicampi TaxID=175306 RepID=A0A4Y9A9Q8_9BACI|nr:FUSC family protein [Lentibacillus salicampi]TFJ91887.1 FUSC family protein [Lentibacillus salicampi]
MATSIIKDALKVKRTPFPWRRAIGAGLSASIPVMIGILLGNFQYGLLAGIGGFSSLYVFNEPYKHRAKKVFFVILGLSAAVGLGTLTAASPVLFSVLLGLIGGVGTFVFGALKIPGPASIFFVIIFAMTSAMEMNPDAALLRAGLVAMGGTVSWLVAMAGWFSDPYEPEKKSIYRLYWALSTLLESIGTANFNEMKEKTLFSLQDAESTLASGYISWRSTDSFKRLYVLKELAHGIWMDILEMEAEGKKEVPPKMSVFLQQITDALQKKHPAISITAPDMKQLNTREERLLAKLVEANAVIHETFPNLDQEVHLQKQPIIKKFADAFDKNALVFLTSVRYAIVLGLAALIAFSFEFDRSYWIPVSCGSVMLGSTIISTFHRSIQRSLGTLTGIIVAVVILSISPAPIVVVLLIAMFHFLTETFMVRNYALAVTFITPNAILMAESTTQIQNLSYFATARITDIIIGCIIGIIGVLLVGRHSASSRLPHLMSKTIRSQSQLFFKIFSENSVSIASDFHRTQNKMQTNLNNLRTVYNTSLGEIPNDFDYLSRLSPAIFSMEQLGYFLDTAAENGGATGLSKAEVAEFIYLFETMAQSIEQYRLLGTFDIPDIPEHAQVRQEVNTLQETLKLSLTRSAEKGGG